MLARLELSEARIFRAFIYIFISFFFYFYYYFFVLFPFFSRMCPVKKYKSKHAADCEAD